MSNLGGPGYESKFGGLWIDRSDWQCELSEKVSRGEVSSETARRIESFLRDGYVVIENAVPRRVTAQIRQELDQLWRNPPDDARVETFANGNGLEILKPELRFRDQVSKLLDLHAFSRTAREATAAPQVVEFLSAVLESKPKAFQSLAFWKGSGQPIHKDSAYVEIDGNPMHIAATWLALEDIKPGTGELEYYVGSHRVPEFLFGGEHKWLSQAPHDHDAFLASHHDDAERYGLQRMSFLAKEGDVLVWHADLAHGGSAVIDQSGTRQSLVTHFTKETSDPPYQRHAARLPLEQSGVLFISQHKAIEQSPEAGRSWRSRFRKELR